MPAAIRPAAELCLFRIVQEALQNIVKHSGAATAVVGLSGLPESLRLEISDFGMGLLSMRELGDTEVFRENARIESPR